jgi:hypothetical protein
VNGTERLQTVSPETNRLYFDLISRFEALTGAPVALNTSFPVRRSPRAPKPWRRRLGIGSFWLQRDEPANGARPRP